MLLEYEWGNPAAAAAAMLLFGEESGLPDQQQQQVLDHHHYVNSLGMDFFQQPQPPPLFSDPSLSAPPCHQRYGLTTLPPLPPARIGLNLGERTYFSLASPPKEDMMARRGVCRRRTRTARCQAEGCGLDLTHAKHYHRRHKVCEFHSKASLVMTAGLSQRFCQQCSRFHVLSEFDQGKRSCRKRLAEHNRRRRKSHDLSTPSTAAIAKDDNNTANTTTTTTNITPRNQEITSPNVTQKSSSPTEQAPVPTVTVLSESSSTETSPPPCLLHGAVGRLGSHEHRFADWNEGEVDGTSSIKITYDQNH